MQIKNTANIQSPGYTRDGIRCAGEVSIHCWPATPLWTLYRDHVSLFLSIICKTKPKVNCHFSELIYKQVLLLVQSISSSSWSFTLPHPRENNIKLIQIKYRQMKSETNSPSFVLRHWYSFVRCWSTFGAVPPHVIKATFSSTP